MCLFCLFLIISPKILVIVSGSSMQSGRREESVYSKLSQFLILIFTITLKHKVRDEFVPSDKIINL